MAPEALEQAPLTPEVSRRKLLRTATEVAVGLTTMQIKGLFADEKVDVSKLSANQLLRALPDTIRFDENNVATIEKCEAKNAKYLMIVLRNTHKAEGDEVAKLTENDLRAIRDSDKENGMLIKYLRYRWGVKHIGLEGSAVEDSFKSRIKEIEGIKKLRNNIADGTFRNRTDLQKRATELNNELTEALKEIIPYDSLVEMIIKEDINTVPIEKRETLDAGLDSEATFRMVRNDREKACLELLSIHLNDKTNRVACVWGANHWKIDGLSRLPLEVHNWNIHPLHYEQRFSVAIITPPSVKKHEEYEIKMGRTK